MKEIIRKRLLNYRNQLTTKQVKFLSKEVVFNIEKDINFINSKVIAIYNPIKNEVDVTSLVKKYSDKIFLYPIIDENDNLIFVKPLDDEFINKKYNILEPINYIVYDKNQINYFLIPALAVSKTNYRIGYGKGYYDKYLKNVDAFKVAPVYSFQILDDVNKIYETDQKIDYYISSNIYDVVLLGGGSSTRYLTNDKNLTKIYDQELYKYTLIPFLQMNYNIILVVPKKTYNKYEVSNEITKITGGKNRTESLEKALKYLKNKKVLVHDLARPLIERKDIIDLVCNFKYSGVFLANKVISSLKKIESNEIITKNRDNYFTSLTPQLFYTKDLIKLFKLNILNKSYQDEVEMFYDLFKNKKLNILVTNSELKKITYQKDLEIIQKLLKKPTLVGHSYDLHKIVFSNDKKLVIGGIIIRDSNYYVDAVSDGDVLLHSLSEAILGALSKGDLGDNFDPKDEKNQNLSSEKILDKALTYLLETNYQIKNVDIMLYIEKPKFKKYKNLIKNNLSKLLSLNVNNISLKLTTAEKLGPIGNNLMIAAETHLLLEDI